MGWRNALKQIYHQLEQANRLLDQAASFPQLILLKVMIFALSTDDRTLHVFASEKEATAYVEGVDVEAGGWLFFGAKGEILHPEFTVPNKWNKFFVMSGKYVLVHRGDQEDGLSDILHTVLAVEGEAPFCNVEAVKKCLTLNRTGTRAPDSTHQ